MPQRALQAPMWSDKVSALDICATRPAAVSSHAMNPGTLSVISPPPAEVGGPQQGGFSGLFTSGVVHVTVRPNFGLSFVSDRLLLLVDGEL